MEHIYPVFGSNLDWHECCCLIVEQCKDGYARAYALRGLEMIEGSEEARVQAMYVLNNLQYWRGGRSKDVKAYLKHMIKNRG
jgi:hypothetical protein